MVKRGRIPTEVHAIVTKAFMQGFSTKSDFARENADWVAMAACLGLISTSVPNRGFGRTWRVTESGLRMIKEMK